MLMRLIVGQKAHPLYCLFIFCARIRRAFCPRGVPRYEDGELDFRGGQFKRAFLENVAADRWQVSNSLPRMLGILVHSLQNRFNLFWYMMLWLFVHTRATRYSSCAASPLRSLVVLRSKKIIRLQREWEGNYTTHSLTLPKNSMRSIRVVSSSP